MTETYKKLQEAFEIAVLENREGEQVILNILLGAIDAGELDLLVKVNTEFLQEIIIPKVENKIQEKVELRQSILN